MANSQGLMASSAAPQATAQGVKLKDRAEPVLQATSLASAGAAPKRVKAIRDTIINGKKIFGMDIY